MSRRKKVLKRSKILADKTYNSVLVSRLINRVMWDGKKTVATRIVNNALIKASEELKVAPVELLEAVIENVKPQIEVKSVRVGGANYQVPIEPYPARSLRLGLTWLVNSARNIKGKPFENRLSELLIQSYNSEGPVVAKRNTVHQTAAGNKAFAHLASRIRKR